MCDVYTGYIGSLMRWELYSTSLSLCLRRRKWKKMVVEQGVLPMCLYVLPIYSKNIL